MREGGWREDEKGRMREGEREDEGSTMSEEG